MRSLSKMMDLSGRVALVTGGGGHVGAAAAETLVELGATVVLADRDRARCEEIAAVLGSGVGSSVEAIESDLSREKNCRDLVRMVADRFGGLDVIVHSAAFVGTTVNEGWTVPFADQTVAAWDAALRVNLTAAWILVQEARGALAARGSGSVILISSIYGSVGPDMRLYEGLDMHNPAAYGVSKAGLEQMARHLATVLAPSVRVNCVSPGGIARGQPAAFVERYVARTPLQRMASEEDIKGAIAYLASDLSAYVTGQTILVDGGWTAW